MEVTNKFSEGSKLFKDAFRLLFKKPVFLVPIFLCWLVVAFMVLYVRYYFPFPEPLGAALLWVYFFIFVMAYTICLSNIVMLELMQQMEKGENTSLLKALGETITLDSIKIIPIAIVWSIIWFILALLKALTKRKRSSDSRPEPSLEDAARTLGGANNGPFTWLGLGLSLIQDIVRMTIFLALPAIAWENKGPFSAFKTAFSIIRRHPIQFLTAYTLTTITGIFMALPLIPIFLASKAEIDLPGTVWLGVIIYEGIIWTLGIYIEQMTTALLYIWHIRWVNYGSVGDLTTAPKPHLLDEFEDLNYPQTPPPPLQPTSQPPQPPIQSTV